MFNVVWPFCLLVFYMRFVSPNFSVCWWWWWVMVLVMLPGAAGDVSWRWLLFVLCNGWHQLRFASQPSCWVGNRCCLTEWKYSDPFVKHNCYFTQNTLTHTHTIWNTSLTWNYVSNRFFCCRCSPPFLSYCGPFMFYCSFVRSSLPPPLYGPWPLVLLVELAGQQ